MSVLFIIPARGGSKGLPGKNLMPVGGIPLVGRAARLGRRVATALGDGSRVVCSTDDPRIAAAAQEWGAEVPFLRPAELASDTASSLDVVRHALEALAPCEFESVVLLQPTSPLTEPEDVLEALALHRASGEPVVSVCRSEHPGSWNFTLDSQRRLVSSTQEDLVTCRQRGAIIYRLNGALYLAGASSLSAGRGFIGDSTLGFVMPGERSVDVDVEVDLIAARAVAANRAVPSILVGGREIGPRKPSFIIAEAGVNHNGSVALAFELVDAAAGAGADAVKFQTFRSDRLVAAAAPKAEYQKSGSGADESQLAMLRGLELSPADHRRIRERCDQRGIIYLSSPFDEASLELLCDMGVAAIKLGSGELTNHPFLARVARTGRPILLSTGMSSLRETENAVDVLRKSGAQSIALFHCVSSYPTSPAECNLAAIDTMRLAFGVPVGWSDHTLGIHIAVAAVARGASLIEKHLTTDRTLPGPDHAASVEPGEFRDLVRSIRDVESAIGDGVKARRPSEQNTADVARRSVHAARDLAEGQTLVREDVVLLRPGTGIPADRMDEVLGKRARRPIVKGAMLAPEDLD